MNPLLLFLSGVAASFTPCVVVLIPIVLFEVLAKKKSKKRNLLLFSLGFLMFFAVFGYFLADLFSSSIQNGFRLGVGALLAVIGGLSFSGRIKPTNVPITGNPFALGGTFSLLLATNPCTLPYVGLIVASSQATALTNMLIFGAGLLTPSLVFAMLGRRVLGIGRLASKLALKLEKFASILLIVSGIYLALSITSLTQNDVYLVVAMLGVIFILLIKTFFMFNSLSDLKKPTHLLLILSLIFIAIAALEHCSSFFGSAATVFSPSTELLCSQEKFFACPVCTRCIKTFSFALFTGIVGIFLAYRKEY